MDDYIQYHNSELMGVSCLELADGEGSDFSIVTNKPSSNLPGSRIWLIGGLGKPRTYYLCCYFIADKIEPTTGDSYFKFYISGQEGKLFRPAIPINDFPWFKDFLQSQQNFSLGLRKIEKIFVDELENIASGQGVPNLEELALVRNEKITTIREKRASKEYAKNVFEGFYSDKAVQIICARLLADCISTAHQISSDCWSLTLFRDKIRLNVGPVEVLVISSNDLFLVIADSDNESFEENKYRNFVTQPEIHYSSVPINQRRCHIPQEIIEEFYPLIRDNHYRFIQEAAQRRLRTTWKDSFSSGIIYYLNNLLNITLPIPAYFSESTRFEDFISDQDVQDLSIDEKKQIFGGGFGNSETNRKVEQAAISCVIDNYKKRGWSVESVESKNLGFDLLSTKADIHEHVEVKGIQGNLVSFIITAGEVKQSQADEKFVLYVVTSALSNPKTHRFTAKEFNEQFALQTIAYRAFLKQK